MKQLFVILAILLLSVTVFALHEGYKTPFEFQKRLGVQRVTHYDPRVNFAHVDATVYLIPPGPDHPPGAGRGGYAPFYARGTAELQSSTWFGFPRAAVEITTKDIPPSAGNNQLYEAWLVDQDTGYRLSLGTFTAGFGGVGALRYNINNYFDPYDFVEITVEPFDDSDLLPGPVVLLGKIPQPRYFNPDPKSAKMIVEQIREY